MITHVYVGEAKWALFLDFQQAFFEKAILFGPVLKTCRSTSNLINQCSVFFLIVHVSNPHGALLLLHVLYPSLLSTRSHFSLHLTWPATNGNRRRRPNSSGKINSFRSGFGYSKKKVKVLFSFSRFQDWIPLLTYYHII